MDGSVSKGNTLVSTHGCRVEATYCAVNFINLLSAVTLGGVWWAYDGRENGECKTGFGL